MWAGHQTRGDSPEHQEIHGSHMPAKNNDFKDTLLILLCTNFCEGGFYW